MKRVGLFSGLYRIRQTRHVRWLLKTILKNNAYEGVGSDWRKESLLQQHPILKRVLNHRKDDDKRKDDNHRKDDDSGAQDMKSEKFSNTPDGLVVFVRRTNEHGVDGPEDNKEIEVEGAATTEEEEEDPIILLSDLDLLYSHCLQSFLLDILEEIIFCENVPNQLNIMLEEVLEAYNQPENIKNCV